MNEFNSQICTSVEQSQRLLELGLKPETADCMYSVMTKSYNGRYILEEDRQYNLCLFHQEEVQSVGFSQYKHIPAWSLHRLIEMCNNSHFSISLYNNEVSVDRDLFEVYDNAFDNLVSIIERLIKIRHFNKEYLKQ